MPCLMDIGSIGESKESICLETLVVVLVPARYLALASAKTGIPPIE